MDHEQFGTTDDYFRAFKVLVAEGIPENHIALLRAHHTAPHHRATWAQLAAAIGYASGKAVNLQYGTVAARVAQLMGITEVPNGFWLDVLAGWADERDAVSGHTAFILRHPVIEALTRLGVLTGVATGSSEQHTVPVEPTTVKSHWWFGVNNRRTTANAASPGHVHYRDVARFIRGDEPSFAWPYGGAPGSERMYPRMRAGDRLPERADTPQPPASDPRWAHRAGTSVAKPEGSHTRGGLGAIEVEQEHNRLQNSLFQRLCRQFGVDAVVMEEGFADIKVRSPDGSIDLFEVKSDPSPRSAIRAAIGQLLEYNFSATNSGQSVRYLVIAAPSELGPTDTVYFAYLQKAMSVDLRYLQIDSTVAVDSYQVVRDEAVERI